jgi:multidrug resistance protein, MATE family
VPWRRVGQNLAKRGLALRGADCRACLRHSGGDNAAIMNRMGSIEPPVVAAASGPRLAPWRAEAAASLRLGLPLAGAQLAQIAIMATDTVMLGWLGRDALAAGALAVNFYFVTFIIGIGIGVAVAPLAAQAVGRHDLRDARRALRQGLWAIILVAVPLQGILWQAEWILLALGQEPAVAALAGLYLRWMLWGLLPSLGFVVLRSFISAFSRTRAVVLIMVAGVPLNAALVYITMFGHFGLPALGVVGAGLSSSAVNALMFLALLVHLLTDRRFCRFVPLGRFHRADWPKFREIFRVGIPISGAMALEVCFFASGALLMGRIGLDALAAYQIALQVASTTFMVPLGLSQAATVRVGLAVGRRDGAAIARSGWVAFGLGVGFMTAMALVLWLAPQAIVAIFLGDSAANRPVFDLAVTFLMAAAVFQVFDGAQVVGMGALRGLRDTRVPMLIAALGYWGIGFPACLVFGFALGWGGIGIWFGFAAGLAMAAAMLVGRFARLSRKIASRT